MILPRSHLAAASICCLILCSGVAAQNPPVSETNRVLYYDEDGIQKPELAPTDFSSVVSNSCEYDGAGIVRISLVVNPQGKPEDVAPLYPFNDDLDKMAVGVAKVDHFVPGKRDGFPVAVAQELEIRLTLCTIKVVEKDGTTSSRLRLKSTPRQILFPSPKQPLPPLPPIDHQLPVTPELRKRLQEKRSDVSAPVPIETPEAEFPHDQRRNGSGGVCLVQLFVDAKGQPRALRIRRGINEAFDQKALDAVARYRFTPAKRGKDPIPVRMNIEVNFRSY